MTKPKAVALIALTTNNTVAKPHQANDVFCFVSSDRVFSIQKNVSETEDYVILRRYDRSYKLVKHPILNIYTGICDQHKVHVSLKRIVGELRYW